MNDFTRFHRAVQNFFIRQLRKPIWDFEHHVTDPRGRQGRRWKLRTLLNALLVGQLVYLKSLRAVETLTERGGGLLRRMFRRRVPDTTMYDLARRLNAEQLGQMHHAQIRSYNRSKMLEPQGLPCGVIAIDGKCIWSGHYTADPHCQWVHPEDGKPYALLRVARATLISVPAKPCIHQMPIPAETNEMGAFAEMFAQTERLFGILYEIVSLDSGYSSAENARLVNEAGKGYVMGLKENQPTLLEEAKRLLEGRREDEAEIVGDWERRGMERIRRILYRSFEVVGYEGFPGLRQVWRVCQQTMVPAKVETWEKKNKRGETKLKQKVLGWKMDVVENRYFLTNLLPQYLKPSQILLLVRYHWGIENNCFWSLDTQWEEDQKAWVMTGNGLMALSWLRLMAYNLVQLLRHRYLRQHQRNPDRADKRAFWDWFDIIKRALEAPLLVQEAASIGN